MCNQYFHYAVCVGCDEIIKQKYSREISLAVTQKKKQPKHKRFVIEIHFRERSTNP
jgi:hypothetical protein